MIYPNVILIHCLNTLLRGDALLINTFTIYYFSISFRCAKLTQVQIINTNCVNGKKQGFYLKIHAKQRAVLYLSNFGLKSMSGHIILVLNFWQQLSDCTTFPYQHKHTQADCGAAASVLRLPSGHFPNICSSTNLSIQRRTALF